MGADYRQQQEQDEREHKMWIDILNRMEAGRSSYYDAVVVAGKVGLVNDFLRQRMPADQEAPKRPERK